MSELDEHSKSFFSMLQFCVCTLDDRMTECQRRMRHFIVVCWTLSSIVEAVPIYINYIESNNPISHDYIYAFDCN